MAYRRKQQGLSVAIKEAEAEDDVDRSSSNSSSSFLAAKAIRGSSAHRDSSLSSAYSSPLSNANPTTSPSSPIPIKDSQSYQNTSMKNLNESKQGFWGNLARKAKAILDDYDDTPQQPETPQNTTRHMPSKKHDTYNSNESHQKPDSPALLKGLNVITSSINYIGNAVEEGLTIVENRTAGIIQETRKHIQKNPSTVAAQDQRINRPHVQTQGQPQPQPQPLEQTDQELQLKASRDVAMAMAAKAKLLLRELKTVKADLAFAKERCAQLEEENKILRESRERGDNPEDDDLIRLQLESLLAEKARLAHENSVYARENRFLREIVEFHQLTMQDVVYLDEGTEEVTEVYPIKVVSNQHSVPAAPPFPPEVSLQVIGNGLHCHSPPPQVAEISKNASPRSSVSPL